MYDMSICCKCLPLRMEALWLLGHVSWVLEGGINMQDLSTTSTMIS